MKTIIQQAIAKGQKGLSEYESKLIMKNSGIPIARQALAQSKTEALTLARQIGFPVVMKGCSDKYLHKTELGLVKLNLQNESEVSDAYDELTSKNLDLDGVLVTEMIAAEREFVIGLGRDVQFGPYVMFGIGGVYTEALNDVSFRLAPLRRFDAQEMIGEIKAQKLLDDFRGKPAVDREALSDILVRVGRLGAENEEIAEIDINPVILQNTRPVAVDALVVFR